MSDRIQKFHGLSHNTDAEETLIGCVFLEPQLMAMAAEIDPQLLYSQAHRHIWRAMQDLHAEGERPDEMLVIDALQDRGVLESVGGAGHVSSLTMSVVSPARQFEQAMSVVAEKRRRRDLWRLLDNQLSQLADGATAAEVVNEIAGVGEWLASGETTDRASHAATIARELMDDLERRLAGDADDGDALQCGIGPVDALLDGGFVPGMHYIVGAMSGHGKTTFTSAVVAGLLAAHDTIRVDWYSCEVPPKWQFSRIASSYLDVPESYWRRPEAFSTTISRRAIDGLGWGVGLKDRLRIFHTPTIDISDVALKTAARRQSDDGSLVVVVDYIQRAQVGRSAGDDMPRVAGASRALAGLADSQTITIACSQFTEPKSPSEPLPIPKPTMARWARDIHHDACDWLTYHRPCPESLESLAVVQLAKSRYGRLAHALLYGSSKNRFAWWDKSWDLIERRHGDVRVPDVPHLNTRRITA